MGLKSSDRPVKLSVVAVMATMNRSATVVACIRSLAAQSRPPERVIVSNNASSDQTTSDLETLRDAGLPFELTIHPMVKNRGNAGGVEEAMIMAFREGADAVWILDDDSWPRETALEELLADGWSPTVVRHPIQIDPLTDRLTWPMPVRDKRGRWRLVWTTEELPSGNIIPTRASWTGALISREIYEKVGPVNGELFIRGEDEEYPWRIEQAGYTFEAVKNAEMDHPGPQKMVHWQLLGRNLFLERQLPDIKLYYKVRNMVWLKRQQSGNVDALLMALAYIIGISAIDGPQRLSIISKAIGAGWRGRLGAL